MMRGQATSRQSPQITKPSFHTTLENFMPYYTCIKTGVLAYYSGKVVYSVYSAFNSLDPTTRADFCDSPDKPLAAQISVFTVSICSFCFP